MYMCITIHHYRTTFKLAMILHIILILLGFHLTTSIAGIVDILDNSILSSCILPNNSPLAELCSLPNEPVILFNSLTVTANMVCDYDCRCTHGANDRGGRCGTAVDSSVDETFCACDYTRGPGNSMITIVIKLIILLTNV